MSRERPRSRPPEESPLDDDFQDEEILQDYIARLLNMQDTRETFLEEADLETTARDMGLTDEDLAKIAASVAAHQQRAANFAKYNRWDPAIEEYRQAVALQPFNPELTLGLAAAHRGRWQKTGSAEDRAHAERYAQRTIDLDADNEAAFKLLSELDRVPIRATTGTPSSAEVRLSNTLLLAFMIALVVIILGAVLFMFF